MAETLNIVIKTLKAQKHNLTVDLSQTVTDLKAQIESELSLGEASSMKLIHHGKILKNEQGLSAIGLKENDFVVLMTAKKKKKKVVAQPVPAVQQVAPQQQPVQPNPEPAVQADPAPQAPQANNLVPNNQLEETVNNLMTMGFPRDQCVVALRAAFNNPDRAVEYLLNGIPPNLLQEQAAPQPAPAQPQQGQAQQPGGGLGPILQEQGLPGQLLASMLQNPQLLNELMQVIHASRPNEAASLLQNLQANPQQALQSFTELLNDVEILQRCLQRMIQNYNGGAPGGGQRGGQQGQPRRIELTPAEMGQIQRLQTLTNCTQEEAVRAYISTNRNLELAASFIFEQGAVQMPAQVQPPAQAPAPMQLDPPAQQPPAQQPPIQEPEPNAMEVEDQQPQNPDVPAPQEPEDNPNPNPE